MKYIANLLWAFLFSWFSRSVIRQHAHSPEMQQLTYWIFDVPLEIQIAVLWVAFSFPKSTGRLLSLLASALLQGLNYAATGIGQLIETMWRYRAGKIVLGAGMAYLAYYFIF